MTIACSSSAGAKDLTSINARRGATAQGAPALPDGEIAVSDVRIDEALWATTMAPLGVIERWFVLDGGWVEAGDPVAEVRIENALHEIAAPAPGQLRIIAGANALVEPGSVVASVDCA